MTRSSDLKLIVVVSLHKAKSCGQSHRKTAASLLLSLRTTLCHLGTIMKAKQPTFFAHCTALLLA